MEEWNDSLLWHVNFYQSLYLSHNFHSPTQHHIPLLSHIHSNTICNTRILLLWVHLSWPSHVSLSNLVLELMSPRKGKLRKAQLHFLCQDYGIHSLCKIKKHIENIFAYRLVTEYTNWMRYAICIDKCVLQCYEGFVILHVRRPQNAPWKYRGINTIQQGPSVLYQFTWI